MPAGCREVKQTSSHYVTHQQEHVLVCILALEQKCHSLFQFSLVSSTNFQTYLHLSTAETSQFHEKTIFTAMKNFLKYTIHNNNTGMLKRQLACKIAQQYDHPLVSQLYFSINRLKLQKNGHHQFPESKVTSLNVLSSDQKPKVIAFTLI